MTQRFLNWLHQRWDKRTPLPDELLQDYRATFATLSGQNVLRHLLDNIYCRVYEGTDPLESHKHNARRSVIQEILENIDRAEAIDTPVKVDKGEFANG